VEPATVSTSLGHHQGLTVQVQEQPMVSVQTAYRILASKLNSTLNPQFSGLTKSFLSVDKKRSGLIGPEEFSKLLLAFSVRLSGPEDEAALFATIDKSGKGELTFQELRDNFGPTKKTIGDLGSKLQARKDCFNESIQKRLAEAVYGGRKISINPTLTHADRIDLMQQYAPLGTGRSSSAMCSACSFSTAITQRQEPTTARSAAGMTSVTGTRRIDHARANPKEVYNLRVTKTRLTTRKRPKSAPHKREDIAGHFKSYLT